MENSIIIVAGATGNLGERIVRNLVKRQARVRALVRRGASSDKLQCLQKLGVEIVDVDFGKVSELTTACLGGACVISAFSGLRDVIVDTQTVLLQAAVNAFVPRFIPSDFATDFTKLPLGKNRNFDLRREFHQRLESVPIKVTSILNGAFTDMLTGQMPIILFKLKRVIYWHEADQLLDFTTIEDTAAFTAEAALDPSTPRILRVAGDQISIRGLAAVLSQITGENFKPLRLGSLGMLAALITITRFLFPGNKEIYPAWQGMQYLHNMFEGHTKLAPLDNDRYSGIQWTSVKDMLHSHQLTL